MAFIDMYSELAGRVPDLSPFLAKKFVNRGWRDIRDARAWSFLIQPGLMQAPASVQAGTVAVVKGSTTVTPDVAAAAALNAANSNPALTVRQFRVGMTGAVYDIASWTSPSGPLVLAQAFQDDTNAAASYEVYQCYFSPPSTDFIRWLSIYDPDHAYPFTKLHVSQVELNRMDPSRSNDGLAYWSVDYAADSSGNPRYEFWPHPTDGQNYVVLYQRRGLDLTAPTDQLPAIINEGLVMDRAMRYAYTWAMTNSGRFPALKGVNWGFLKTDAEKTYPWDLQRAKRLDDEVFLRNKVVFQGGLRSPMDANYLQGHTGFGWFGWP